MIDLFGRKAAQRAAEAEAKASTAEARAAGAEATTAALRDELGREMERNLQLTRQMIALLDKRAFYELEKPERVIESRETQHDHKMPQMGRRTMTAGRKMIESIKKRGDGDELQGN